MTSVRYSDTRQRSCKACAAAKTRCDRKERGCARCIRRQLECIYPIITLPLSSNVALNPSRNAALYPSKSAALNNIPKFRRDDNETSGEGLTNTKFSDNWTPESQIRPTTTDNVDTPTILKSRAKHFVAPKQSKQNANIDVQNHELVCPIDPDDISNRWLNTYIPSPDQAPKSYPPAITAFISRILKSYTNVTIRGRNLPSFVHPLQLNANSSSQPLTVCLSLAGVCGKRLAGANAVAIDILQREMGKLYEEYSSYSHATQLAAFQAYLIYSMILYFRLDLTGDPFLSQAMMRCQELACATSRRGLVCSAEQEKARPRWENWVIAEAKRRSLYIMYLFDNLLSIQDGLPIFLGTELKGLPAPASKTLWQAEDRAEWEELYNTHLAAWTSSSLSIDELWPIPSDLDASGTAARRDRVDHWLEDVDEFGTMLYAVTSCTHGS